MGVGNGMLNPEQMEALWAYVIAGEAGNWIRDARRADRARPPRDINSSPLELDFD